MKMQWMIMAALMLGVAAPMTISAQDKAGDEAKADGTEKDGEAKKDDEAKVKLPESDAKAQTALKDAYEKIYSPRAKGMTKLYGKFKMTSNFTIKMGESEMPMTTTLDYLFVWNGSDPVAIKDVTEGEGNAQMRMALKQQADGIGAFIDLMIGSQSFAERYAEGTAAFAFKEASDEDKKAKIERVLVTTLKDKVLAEETYVLKDGLISKIPNAGGAMDVEWVKKGRDLFLKSVSASTSNRGVAVDQAYEFSKIKKAGKYSIPTMISVATKSNFGSGTTETVLSDFKVDVAVTQKMIDEVIPPKAKDDEASSEDDKDGDKKDATKKEDESPIKGVSKKDYETAKKRFKDFMGREPTDEEIKAMAKRMGGGR